VDLNDVCSIRDQVVSGIIGIATRCRYLREMLEACGPSHDGFTTDFAPIFTRSDYLD
jgi:hypothetical protein